MLVALWSAVPSPRFLSFTRRFKEMGALRPIAGAAHAMSHEAFFRRRRGKSPGKPGVHSRPRERSKSQSYIRGKSVGVLSRLIIYTKASQHSQAQETLPKIRPKRRPERPAKTRRRTRQGPVARPGALDTGPGLFRACRPRQTSLVIIKMYFSPCFTKKF